MVSSFIIGINEPQRAIQSAERESLEIYVRCALRTLRLLRTKTIFSFELGVKISNLMILALANTDANLQ
jgi:hypothetical protein